MMRRRAWTLSWAGPAGLTLVVLGFGLTQDSFYRLQLATLAGVYAIAAVGLTLLFGGAGQISLGQAGFVGTGAVVTAGLSVQVGLPLLPAALAGVMVSSAVGLLIGWSALRLSGHYLALATLAFGLLFTELVKTVLPVGFYGVPSLRLLGVDLSDPTGLFLAVWGVVITVYVGAVLLVRSRFGRSLAALRDDEVAARSCGVDIARAKVTVFALSAALAGLSGALFAVYQGSVTEASFSFVLSVNLLIMVVIGGLGSPAGAVLGAVFLVLAPELGRGYEDWRLVGYGVLLVAVVALLPGGLTSLAGRTRFMLSAMSSGRGR